MLNCLASIDLSLRSLVSIVIYLCVVGGVVWLLMWLVDYVGLPAPFNKVAKIVIMVFVVLALISLLLGFTGYPVVTIWR
jgi:uncharacterized membrane protein YtjA (UPF0391 family)